MEPNPQAQSEAPSATPAFGRYRIVKKIASGGMGEIYLASLEREEGFSKQVVIKKLLPSLSRNPAFVSMFNNEARLAAQLSHTNVIQIFDFGRMEDTQFIAMEWVHGENLGDVLSAAKERKAPIPLRVALDVALGVLRGLDYAHRKLGPKGERLDLIHRDIAPKNILLSYEGDVKIIDFGLAKAAAASDATEGGALKGSYCYMSPEQVGGRAMDARSDLFSIALVLFEMIRGERLYPAELGLRPLLEAIHKGDLSHWTDKGRDPFGELPGGLGQILQKALAKEPAARFQTAREFIEALEGFIRESNGSLPEGSVREYLHALYSEKIASDTPSAASEAGFDRTRVNSGAQQALAQASAQEQAKTRRRSSRASSLLFNLLALTIIVAIVAGGGILAYHFWWKPAQIAKTLGAVRIVTDPPDATILYDGKPLSLTSPATIERFPVGSEHVIRVEKTGYQPMERRVGLDKGGGAPVLQQFTLARSVGQVFLTTNPPGATVKLDGTQLAGKTPVLLEQVEVGVEHSLEITLDKHRDEPINFVIESPDRTQRFTLDMVPLRAGLSINSRPRGVPVFINGERRGKTPFNTTHVEIGEKLSVRLKKAGYAGEVQNLTVKSGPNNLNFNLEPLVVETRLRSKGAVEVLLNDKAVPSNPIRLSVGNHLIRVRVKDADEEFRLRIKVHEHARRPNGLVLEANADARPWAKVKTESGKKSSDELTTPVSGIVFGKGPGRLLAALPGGARLELSFEVP
ncbi:MAG: serine/threonine protein kinase [Chrysiogenetes bacterium]|nr:serine/threonine protein kinase [Chrysiogenetes bacterium]